MSTALDTSIDPMSRRQAWRSVASVLLSSKAFCCSPCVPVSREVSNGLPFRLPVHRVMDLGLQGVIPPDPGSADPRAMTCVPLGRVRTSNVYTFSILLALCPCLYYITLLGPSDSSSLSIPLQQPRSTAHCPLSTPTPTQHQQQQQQRR